MVAECLSSVFVNLSFIMIVSSYIFQLKCTVPCCSSLLHGLSTFLNFSHVSTISLFSQSSPHMDLIVDIPFPTHQSSVAG